MRLTVPAASVRRSTVLLTPFFVGRAVLAVVRAAAGRAVRGRALRDVAGDTGLAARGGGAGAREGLGLRRLLEGRARLGVGQLLLRGLVDVEIGAHGDLRLAVAEGLVEHRGELRLDLGAVARLGLRLGHRRAGVAAVALRPQHVARAVGDRDLVLLEALDRAGDEAGDAAHLRGLDVLAAAAEQDGGRRRLLLVGEELVAGQRELHAGAAGAGHAVDRLCDLALEGALVGDLLLEVAGAELLLGHEVLEAGLRGGARVDARARRGRRAPARSCPSARRSRCRCSAARRRRPRRPGPW